MLGDQKKEEQAWQERRTELKAVADVCRLKQRNGCRPHKTQDWQAQGRPRSMVPHARQDGKQAHESEYHEWKVP